MLGRCASANSASSKLDPPSSFVRESTDALDELIRIGHGRVPHREPQAIPVQPQLEPQHR